MAILLAAKGTATHHPQANAITVEPTVHSRRQESHRKQMHVISPSLLE
jgi:hypothetical protein